MSRSSKKDEGGMKANSPEFLDLVNLDSFKIFAGLSKRNAQSQVLRVA